MTNQRMTKRRVTIFIATAAVAVLALVIILQHKSAGKDDPEPGLPVDTVSPVMMYGVDMTECVIVDSILPSGAFFGGLMSAAGVPGHDIHEMVTIADTVFDLKRMRAGNRCSFIYENSPDKRLRWFVYNIDRVEYVIFDFGDPKSVARGARVVDTTRNQYSGIISSSLWNAMKDDGKDPNLILSMSDIFAWVIDFYGIQKEDKFKVIYDELFVEGESIGIGTIHAAWFDHVGKYYYAFRYEQDSVMQYFDEEGTSLRREFLKAPLQFRRISSHFSHNRLHPILRRYRAHHGVDYAAPSGTPVQTIGDGTVLEARYAGGAGNMVKIRHNSTYTTVYMHLRGFAKGIRAGVRVGQGELIGYVGSTGLSTGPHLDFRVYKNGTPINPLKLESPPAEPVHPDRLDQYKVDIQKRKNQLDKIQKRELRE